MSIGGRLRQVRGSLSQKEMALRLGVHFNTYANYERGKRQPAWTFIRRLVESFDIDEHWLLTGEGAMRRRLLVIPTEEARRKEPLDTAGFCGERADFVSVPKLAHIRRGKEGFPEIRSDPHSDYAFRREWIASRGSVDRMILMRFSGDSMEPTLLDGDCLLVDRSAVSLTGGNIYAFLMDEVLLFRRLDVRPGTLVFLSDNTRYPPIHIPLAQLDRILVIGRVVWLGREL